MSQQSTIRQPRRRDLDFLRVAAMMAVIVIHCVMPITIMRLPGDADWPAAELLDSYMRWCVPVFVMISGALLIRPSTYQNLRRYFYRRVSRILVPLVAWPILYALWLLAAGNSQVTWQAFWHGIAMGDPIGGTQLYFLFIIAGLYVLAPLVSLYAAKVRSSTFRLTALILLAAASIWYMVAATIPGYSGSYMALTWCLPFIGYFMLGLSLRDLQPRRIQTILAVVGFMTLGLLNTVLTTFTRIDDNFFFQSYQSPTVIGLSICAFVGGKALYARLAASTWPSSVRAFLGRSLSWLSRASFGVYLVHVMILDTIVLLFALDKGSLATAGWLLVAVPPLSFVTVAILLKTPGLKRLVN